MRVHGQLILAGLETVSSLPTTDLFVGRQILLTTTNVAYIYYGSTWNAFGSGGGGGGGAVDSVFGRSGAVVAATNDYNADQIDDSSTTNKFATASQLAAIATNTSNISTNTSNISTNTSNISTNTSDIATNASDISTNTSAISTNATAIATKENSLGNPAGNAYVLASTVAGARSWVQRVLSTNADVSITSIAADEILKWNGSAWINNTLAEAGIMPDEFTTRGDLLYRGASAATRLAIGSANQYLTSNGTDPQWSTLDIVNANINASAAIAVSKLAAITASRAVVSDGSGFISASAVTATELAYVSGVTSAIQTQINALNNGTATYGISEFTEETAAIGDWNNNSGLTLISGNFRWRREGSGLRVQGDYAFNGTGTDSGSFTFDLSGIMTGITADMSTSDFHYLSAGSANDTSDARTVSVRIAHTGVGTGTLYFGVDGSGTLTGTGVGNVTSGDVQAIGFDVLIPISEWSADESLDPLTTDGDLVYYSSGVTRLAIGSEGQVLTVSSGLPVWSTSPSGFADPMTTRGDIIYRASGGTTRLPLGTSGQYLTSDGTDILWGDLDISGQSVDDLSDVTITSPSTNDLLRYNGSAWVNATIASLNIVTNSGSSTDNTIPRFDSTTGKIIQSSGVVISDTDDVSGVTTLDVDGTTESTSATTGSIKSAGGISAQKNIVSGGQIGAVRNNAGNSGTSKTIDWNDSNVQTLTLNGNVTLTLSNPIDGMAYNLILIQDATGSRTVTWPGTVEWPSGTAPTLSTAASSIDVVTLIWDGTRYLANSALDFS